MSRDKRALILSPDAVLPTGSEPATTDAALATLRAQQVLRDRGFDVELLAGPAATRDGILCGYDRLIDSTHRDDAAVLYYLGHGGFWWLENDLRWCQYIVPADMDIERDAAWRGITSWELAIKLGQLTAKTANATVIVDACNAGRMSFKVPEGRSGTFEFSDPRTYPHRHLGELRRHYGSAFDSVDTPGDSIAVRFSSTSGANSAFDYFFTRALLDEIESSGEQTTWEKVSTSVRARVLEALKVQRPEIAGPLRRRLFELDERDGRGLLAIALTKDLYEIPSGELAGDIPGDTYAIVSFDKDGQDGEVVVTHVLPLLSLAKGPPSKAPYVLAVPHARQTRYPIVVESSVSLKCSVETAISCAIEQSLLLREVCKGEEEALATVHYDGRQLAILDSTGAMVFPPVTYPGHLDETVRNLVALARARQLRDLAGPHGIEEGAIQIELGVLRDGEYQRCDEDVPVLTTRDRLFVGVRSNDRESNLFVHVFHIDVRGTLTILTAGNPVGEPLSYDAPSFTIGRTRFGTAQGIALDWPTGFPVTTGGRDMAIVVLVATAEVDVRNFAGPTFLPPSSPMEARTVASCDCFSVSLRRCTLVPVDHTMRE